MQIETVETNSFEMDYFRFGRGNDTLVILPGLSVQSVMNVADAVATAYRLLADDFTIYLFDRRKSFSAPYTVRMMAHDTCEALRALELDCINLFGTSLGGMTALQIAIDQPGFVGKLVLGSTSARVSEEQYRTIEHWIRLAEEGDAAALNLAFGEAIFPPTMFEQLRELLLDAAKSVTDEELRRFIILAQGIRGFDVLNDLKEITCPTLAIGSSDDQVLGADATLQIAERLGARPDFQLHMYDGYGHAAYDTAPDYKERLLRFLVA